MARRGGTWWRGTVMVAGMLGLAVSLAVVAAALRGKQGLQTAANVAQLLSLLLGVPALVSALLRWRQRPRVLAAPTTTDIARAKDVLAGLVAEQWRVEAAVRSLDDPDPMPVRWRLTEHADVMDHPSNVASGKLLLAGSSDQIAELADRFRGLRRPRLVVLGGPGTGKTTLAVQLLLQLLATRRDEEPVAVLFSVADWDTQAFPRPQDWLAARLRQDYPALNAPGLGADVPKVLTARAQILPVLDGLDELPKAARAAVIAALNRSLGAEQQLILTSRTTEFTQAAQMAGDVLTSAAVIEPQPLTPTAAADYLRSCLPPAAGPGWEQVLSGLRAETHPRGPQAALAEMVSTPLGLWLLRTVYLAPGADPAQLLHPGRFSDGAALRAHLFDRLIGAVITTRPPSNDASDLFRPRRRWNPDQVSHWLGYLACYLNRLPTAEGQRGTRDFAWWRLAHHTLHPRTLPLVISLTASIAGGLVGGFMGELGDGLTLFSGTVLGGLLFGLVGGLVGRLMGGLASGLVGGLVIGLVGRLSDNLTVGLSLAGLLVSGLVGGLSASSWHKEGPGFADLHLDGRVSSLARQIIRNGLRFGPVAGLVGGLALLLRGFDVGITGATTGALLVGLAGGLIAWAETPIPENQASTPLASWRADRTLNLSRIIVFGLAFGLVFGLPLGLAFEINLGFPRALMAGLGVGLPLGIGAGLVFGSHHAWVAYAVATYRLACGHRLPRQLMPFLDDAHRLGLLRTVGPIYQFRHAELQDHLASAYRP